MNLSAGNRVGLAGKWAPNATVFVSSGCIMLVELVAGRLISRYVGQSLYTWTSIIGVVLAGISLGNYIGGRVADRRSGRGTLAVQFVLAGLACLSVLALNELAGRLQCLIALPWPARIFAHVTLAFMIPSTLLGTISPVVAKRALNLGLATGRTMGNVYAWAIAGSIIGTFLTGYCLLMWMGNTALVCSAAAVLALVALAYGIGALLPQRPVPSVEAEADESQEQAEGASEGGRLRDSFVPIAAVFVASACVMAMEMAAARLVSRTYGQSLYTWTTIIGVVLAGMSFGSYAGGRAADRFRVDQALCTLFVLSSASCLAIPAINKAFAVSSLLEGLSWPVRIAVNSAAAFAMPSILLGAIPPVGVKMALMRTRAQGRTVGSVYAWGSVGSIAGTFLAGYWLIAAFGMIHTVCIVAGVLALMGILYGLKTKLAWGWGIACAVALVSAAVPLPGVQTIGLALVLRQLQPADVVYLDESQYSYIKVLADEDDPTLRSMVLDNLIHSKVDLEEPRKLRYEYEWVYGAVLDNYHPEGVPLTAMAIGGGGYSFPRYLEVTRPGSHIDVSEIDPAVTEAAHAACGLPRDTAIHIFDMDARNHVDDLVRRKRAGIPAPRFDCIFGDSLNDYSVPYHLTTLEFNERLNELLTDSGLYLLNIIDMLDSGKFLGAVISTCRETFPHVYAFTGHEGGIRRDTFIVVSSKRPLELEGVTDRLRRQYGFEGRLLTPVQLDALAMRVGNAPLTDDFAPVENMLAPVVRGTKDDLLATLLKSADKLLAEGKPGEAVTKCQKALRYWPQSAETYELLGVAVRDTGDLDGAIDALRKAVEAFPGRESPHNELGYALFKKGALDEAIGEWHAAIDINPRHVSAYENLGGGLIHKGDMAGAADALRKAIELDPRSASARNNLAVALFNQGDIEGAIAEFTATLDVDPYYAGVHPQLAVAYWKIKDYDNAWAEIEKCREAGEPLDPNFIQTLERDSGRSRR